MISLRGRLPVLVVVRATSGAWRRLYYWGILTCSALMDGRGSQTRILMGRDTLMTSVPSHTDTLHCQSGALLQTFIMTEVSKSLHLFMLIFIVPVALLIWKRENVRWIIFTYPSTALPTSCYVCEVPCNVNDIIE